LAARVGGSIDRIDRHPLTHFGPEEVYQTRVKLNKPEYGLLEVKEPT
jgi:hypothetical protein